MTESTTSLSFKFSKTSKKRLNVKTDEEEEIQSTKIFIASVDRRGFKNTEEITKKEEKKLVIPALENTLRLNPKDDVDSIARRALIEDARRFAEKPDLSTKEIEPIPLQESSSKDKERLDVSQLADIPEEADYESVPVDAFGKALLRGMGWKEGDAIGRSNKKATAPIVTAPRPTRLGLGAEIKPPPENDKDPPSKKQKS